MKDSLYITSHGTLSRLGNTLYFINKDVKKPLPVNRINEINCYGKVTLKSGASSMLMKMGVPVNFFNKYGYYEGSLYPRLQLNSGLVVVKQSEHYLDPDKRSEIAKEMVLGIKHNLLKSLKYYRKKGKDVDPYIDIIKKERVEGDVPQLMSSEGRMWNAYYQSFNTVLKKFKMVKREIRPPTTELNALISFGNSLLYVSALSEIYHTYLHPSISFLHEPAERRFSLSLDIADIFKPLIVGRVISKLVNNNMISEKDFERDIGVMLNDRGKRIFLKEYQNKLETTIKHPKIKRKVSYKYLMRLEAYKLIKHVLGDQEYESFKAWW
ncbi:type I-B CRISPR-associated endonuclease Cas1b [Methanothermobacter wolfeii]|uniref:CRISPR-associated endonuclease Cas1 n=1 Tax=Methanothermobacter wolfeii TaxID=145261 RepID=A0ABU8TUT5_METWO